MSIFNLEIILDRLIIYWAQNDKTFHDSHPMEQRPEYLEKHYGSLLWIYKDASNGNKTAQDILTSNEPIIEKVSQLESFGAKFRRDVILAEAKMAYSRVISDANTKLNDPKSYANDRRVGDVLRSTKEKYEKLWNKADKEQKEITQKYGK